MKENRIATKLDDIFSDSRLNIHALAMVTKRVLSRHAQVTLDDWYMAHKLAVDPEITGQEMLEFVDSFDYSDAVDLSDWGR